MPKFTEANKVNYRQEDEIVNNPHSCMQLSAVFIEHPKKVKLTSRDAKVIQVYNIGMRKRKMSRDSSQNQLHYLNTEQYISIKVSYCKIYIT